MTWNAPCFLLFLPEPSSTLLSARNKSNNQYRIIAKLESDGHDTAPAVELLKQFIETQQDHEEDRDRLLSKLAAAS